ncbi:MAG: membrane protein insertase YidC [Planctomycetales bacterium]
MQLSFSLRKTSRKVPYLKSIRPILVAENVAKPEKSDLSVLLTSKDLELAPAGKEGASVTHKYLLFAGPKREEFLRPIDAQHIIIYGMAGNLGITQLMQGLLNVFHSLLPSWAWPWGWSIIMLTIVVRMAMFPFSRKQALSAARMQELQPEIAALKKKYAKEPEKLGRAQMELFRKNNYNPFGGCLILFIQLPIFIGLYQALNISVDLRMAEFLWIKNLAAPDALFRFPFKHWPLPILDSWIGPTFNLLPIFTIVLFMIQQKMMMPPPTDKEQEMQQNMMKYMMIFMGLMFYGVPAGLCVYFISSSLWGLAERKLIPKTLKPKGTADAPNVAVAAGGKK